MDRITLAETAALRQSAEGKAGYWSSIDTWTKPFPPPWPTTITAKNKAIEVDHRSTFSPILDLLPVELRLIIFRLVLRAERTLVKVPRRAKGLDARRECVIFNTSLLRVNRQIGEEARDAFFDVNLVHLSQTEDRLFYLDDLRQVELTGDIASRICDESDSATPYLDIKTFATLPKLRKLIIACDTLSLPYRRLRWHLEKYVGSRMEITCFDFGLFVLKIPVKTRARIYFKHFALRAVLPSAKARASSIPLKALNQMVGHYLRDGHQTLPISTESPRALLLARWLSGYEAMRVFEADPNTTKLDDEEKALADLFKEDYLATTEIDPTLDEGLPEGAGFLALDSFDCGDDDGAQDECEEDGEDEDEDEDEVGEDLIEWASEVMSHHLAILEDMVREEDKFSEGWLD